MQEGESLARRHLVDLARRHLADDDPEWVAEVLLSQPDHPEYDELVADLDASIVQSSQGHPRGITADERKALGGNWLMPDYLLGPGDQKSYAALRDSNLLNAVVGRRPVKDVDALIGGKNYHETDGEPVPVQYETHVVDGEVVPGFSRRWKLAEAGHDYQTASQMPTKHSTLFGSPYHQHKTMGDGVRGGTINNSWENNRDGVVGQVLGELNQWSTAAQRAGRTPGAWGGDSHSIDGTVGAVAKSAANFIPQFIGAGTQEWADNATKRASPLVPNRVSDPQLRQDSIDNLKHFSSEATTPDVLDYGKSIGRGYSPALGWAFDMANEVADPTTALSLGVGFVPRLATNMVTRGAGMGVLKSLADEAPKMLAREGVQEATSPMTLGIGALTFPKVVGAFRGTTVSPEEQAKAAQQLEEQHARTNEALKTIRAAKNDY